MPERFYVTTPIYYLNAAPHVGSAYTTIVADVLARYHRLQNRDVFFLTGTDEHGLKIAKVAAEQGIEPQAYTDKMAAVFEDAWRKLDISPDHFIRTTSPEHKRRAQAFWEKVASSGHIYLGEYEGWYCVSEETFYPEKDVKDGKVIATGRPVERVKEPSYFFKLSAFRDRLLSFYDRHPKFVEPEGRFNEVRAFVERELSDLSISRTSFDWGIPVPGDPKHVMYVWFDALTNYLTALGDDTSRWPPDVHLVGKEITRFHCVFWPAFLMAAGYEEDALPKKVFAHGWLTVDGKKMAKSDGNVIDPIRLSADPSIGVDALRYYLLRSISFGQDGDFRYEDLIDRINGELGNDLGNLLNRTVGMVTRYFDGVVPPYGVETDLEKDLQASVLKAQAESAEAFEAVAPHKAMDAIWQLIRDTNVYVDRAAPWAVAKTEDRARLGTIMGALLEALRHISTLILPVMPGTASSMYVQLRITVLPGACGDWTDPWTPGMTTGVKLDKGKILFPRITPEERPALLARLRK